MFGIFLKNSFCNLIFFGFDRSAFCNFFYIFHSHCLGKAQSRGRPIVQTQLLEHYFFAVFHFITNEQRGKINSDIFDKMESKASAPLYPPTGIQDAPPSYEASMSQPNYGPPPGASAAPPGKFCNI